MRITTQFLVERSALSRLDNIPFLVLQYALVLFYWPRGYGEVYFLLSLLLLVLQVLAYLGTHWDKRVLAWVCYQPGTRANATHVLVRHDNEKRKHKDWTIVPLESTDKLVFEHKRFAYDDDKKEYAKIAYPVNNQMAFYASAQGLETETLERARSLWVDNVMEIPIPEFLLLLKEHVLAPFFVFQLFCVLLWMLDEYWYFSLYTLVMLLVFESIIVTQRQMNWRRMKSMRVPPEDVKVFRHRQWIEMSSKDLLPGDLISLELKTNKLVVPCDLAIVSGSCTVDESILTGEAVPLLKESISGRSQTDVMDLKRDSGHLLLSGTSILKCTRGTRSATNGPLCYVLRTGWDTTQGKLMRTILFSSERVSVGNWEAYIFIMILLLFAVLATAYMLSHALYDPARDPYKLLLKCVLILTSVVPPELPIELALAVNASIMSLQKKQIFCTEPFRLPFAGRAKICCFDKTGTLTDMDFTIKGVCLPGKNKGESCTLYPLDKSPAAALILGGCQSVSWVEEKWAGDPIEKVCLEELHAMPQGEGVSLKTGDRVTVLRRFQFHADLKRMTAVIRTEGKQGSGLKVVTKGAPEVIKGLLVTVPAYYDEVCSSLTSQGYRTLTLASRDASSSEEHSLPTLKRDDVEKDLIFAGVLALSSPIKPGTLETITEILRSSHRVVMITGDNIHTAAQVAMDLGLGKEICYLGDGGTKVELRNAVGDLLSERPRNAVVCALGKDLPLLADTDWLRHIKVFARTSPSQKEQIIDLLNKKGFTVMCGDGTNDVGGLKKAHVGIALLNKPMASKPVNPMEMPKETVEFGDASIAAPFTSKISNISCVKFLIQHGRCALVTTYQMYRILAVNCLIYAYTLSVLYMDGIKLGDTQSMAQGLVISVFFYFLSTAEPLNKLSRHRPPNSIFQPAIMLSIFLQFITHLTALIFVVNMCQPYLIRSEDWVPDKEFKPDVLNTSVYLLNFWINVVNFLVNYQGEPFMVPLRQNRKLYKFSCIALGVIVLGVFGAFDVDYYLELVQLPDTVVRTSQFQVTLLGVMVSDFAVSYGIEWVLCGRQYS